MTTMPEPLQPDPRPLVRPHGASPGIGAAPRSLIFLLLSALSLAVAASLSVLRRRLWLTRRLRPNSLIL
jgi:hypothetical protein